MGLMHSVGAQKLHLEWASVWRAKCKEFERKMKDFGVSDSGGQRGFAEIVPRVGLSMESKM